MLLNLLETNILLFWEPTSAYVASYKYSLFVSEPHWIYPPGEDELPDLLGVPKLCSIYDLHILSKEQLGE